MGNMPKKAFEKIFQLAFKYPWLKPKTTALGTLLFEDCETEEQAQLIIDILDNLRHITIQEYNDGISNLALDIATCGVEPELTFITAMSADSTADSGQSVLYDLKGELSKLEWTGYRSVNRYDQTPKAYKEFRKTKGDQSITIILVDNFVGTGGTVINRVKRIKELFSESNLPIPNVLVKVLISSKTGDENVKNNNIDFSYSYVVLDNILEKIYDQNQVENKKDMMRTIEGKLSQSHNYRALPSLGYGELQVALSIESKNTPNNVFPIFWWKYYSNYTVRDVLLHRAMDDA